MMNFTQNTKMERNDMERYIFTMRDKIFVPAYERVKQLYALGYRTGEILSIVNSEFADVMVNPLSMDALNGLIGSHKEEMLAARENLGIGFREQIANQMQILHEKTSGIERKLVEVYCGQLNEFLDQMASLDPNEIDENGNYKNTNRLFVLHELIDKFHLKIEKITGTGTLREVEAYRIKLEIKTKAEAGKSMMIPGYDNDEVIEEE